MSTPRSRQPTSGAEAPAARRALSRASSRPAAPVPRLGSFALAAAIFAVYLALCPPVSGDKDSAEFTLVLAKLGTAHPTGYPLFTLFGHAWVMFAHLLGATWAFAANSWTALGGAVAMFLLHRLGIALLAPAQALGRGTRAGLAALPVALFVFNPIWTYETTLAEVYSWHIAWALGTALCFVATVRAIERDGVASARPLVVRAALWGFLCGVGAAHHLTAVFVVLPLSIALGVALAARRRLTPVLVLAALGASGVPLLSYGFILWRASHPAVIQWPWLRTGLGGLLEHVSGRQYVGRLGRFEPSAEQSRFLAWYVWPFLFPGLALLLLHARRASTGRALDRVGARRLGGGRDRLRVLVRGARSVLVLPATARVRAGRARAVVRWVDGREGGLERPGKAHRVGRGAARASVVGAVDPDRPRPRAAPRAI